MKKRLIKAALDARARAYAPYSRYAVGAAVLGGDGKIYSGCNVENVSSGLTVCAERNAVAAMVAAGLRTLSACAIATLDGAPPCGACLQVLAEFAPQPNDCAVIRVDEDGTVVETTLGRLLPERFGRGG
ncbi:MAG: cytidine deaminase [Armatimonadetes bacterium]|nr:cytidine deaminase [Armatimonadota bacterium]